MSAMAIASWRLVLVRAIMQRCFLIGSVVNTSSVSILTQDLVHAAGQRLNDLGHSPTLVVGDGRAGVPDHGPYDRIIANCAVPEIPLAWIEQLAPGGAMLVNLRGEIAGVLCLLGKHNGDGEVIGPVVRCGGNFMWLRRELSSPLRREESSIVVGARKAVRRLTALSPADILDNKDFFWMLQLELAGLRFINAAEVFDPMEKGESARASHVY